MSFFIPIAVFVAVASAVGCVVMVIRGRAEQAVESRLAQLTGSRIAGKDGVLNQSVLSQPLDATQGLLADFFQRFKNLRLLFEQADTSLTPAKFCAISGGLGAAGFLISMVAGCSDVTVNSRLNATYPGSVIETSYVPGARPPIWNDPSGPVTACRSAPDSRFLTVTVTRGSFVPRLSDTVPVIEPRVACA